jgi:glycosyltransferase involved in cell wall biosynthesis
MTSDESRNPLFSIVVPSYNHGNYLQTALNSVLSQTFGNWELIVVDNQSTDNTMDYLSELKDPRIRMVQIQNSGSIAMSRNRGVDLAQGEWIAFLDSDDWWTPEKLQLVSGAITSKTDVIYHNMFIEGESWLYPKLHLIESRQLSSPIFFDLLLHGNPIVTSSTVIRKEILTRVDGMNERIQMRGLEDFNAWLKISRVTEQFMHLNETLGHYRVHETNISYSNFTAVPLVAFEEFFDLIPPKQYQRIISNFEYTAGRIAFLNRQYDQAKVHLWRCFPSSSLNRKLKSLWMIYSVFWISW